jgi:lipopolysaccharide/colanic/teichoic acid biosynthesis glycosyltransferase
MITQWFDPEPTFKGLLFAQELQRHGYDVQVLTGFPNYPGGKIYEGYRTKLFQRETIQGIRVLRVPLYPSHDKSGTKRALNYLTFAMSAMVGALLSKRPDVAYIYHPPATVGIPAIALKFLKGVPYVYDIQDLWPDTLAATGMLGNPRVLAAIGSMMKRVYKSATRITVLSRGFKHALVGRGVPAGRVDVIPNWADERQIDLSPVSALRAKELGFSGKFTVTFAGNIGAGQGLEIVLLAAETMKDESAVHFFIVGGGLELQNLEDLVEERGLTNVEFLPRRPLSEIGEILTLSDALLVHLKEDPLFSITIPSKTQAYLMAGRPILMGVKGDAARLVQEAGAGITFEPEQPMQLARAIRDLMAMGEEKRQAMASSGQAYYRSQLSLEVGASRFARVLESASLLKPWTLAMKRGVDIVLSLLALVVLLVPMLFLGLAVKHKLGGPVLFKQTRPGKNGEPFQMLKFRTMTNARNERGELLPDAERLTPFGSALRLMSLDELPELLNVFLGHMSLVGPRPLLLRYTPFFRGDEKLRLLVKPGISGWAQVHGRNTASWDGRLALDAWYVRNMSLKLDIKILWLTASRVVKRQGVVVDPESVMSNLDDERRGESGK